MPETAYKNIQIEEEFHAKLRDIAAQEHRSMSGMIEVLILREWDKVAATKPAPAPLSQINPGDE